MAVVPLENHAPNETETDDIPTAKENARVGMTSGTGELAHAHIPLEMMTDTAAGTTSVTILGVTHAMQGQVVLSRRPIATYTAALIQSADPVHDIVTSARNAL